MGDAFPFTRGRATSRSGWRPDSRALRRGYSSGTVPASHRLLHSPVVLAATAPVGVSSVGRPIATRPAAQRTKAEACRRIARAAYARPIAAASAATLPSGPTASHAVRFGASHSPHCGAATIRNAEMPAPIQPTLKPDSERPAAAQPDTPCDRQEADADQQLGHARESARPGRRSRPAGRQRRPRRRGRQRLPARPRPPAPAAAGPHRSASTDARPRGAAAGRRVRSQSVGGDRNDGPVTLRNRRNAATRSIPAVRIRSPGLAPPAWTTVPDASRRSPGGGSSSTAGSVPPRCERQDGRHVGRPVGRGRRREIAERELPAAAIELVGCVERDACGRAVDDDPRRPRRSVPYRSAGTSSSGEHRPGRDAIRHRPAAEDRIADEPPDDQDHGKRGQDHGRQVGDLRQRRRHALREQARVGKSSAIQRVLELGHGGRLLRPHSVGGRDAPYVHRQSVGRVRRAHDDRATLITGKVFPAVAIGGRRASTNEPRSTT